MHEFAQKQIAENQCPKCDSTNISHPGGAFRTAVGWFGGPESDPNHWTLECICTSCGLVYDKHWVVKQRRVWKTDREHHVLEGKPGCCQQTYLLPCTCGEWQKHSTYNKSSGMRYGIPTEPRYWKCDACGEKLPDHKYGTRYMTEEALEEARKNPVLIKPSTVPLKFTVTESTGIGVVNTAALSKLTLDK